MLRRYILGLPALAILAGLAGATVARATTLEKLTLDEMIARSTSIVRGKVIESGGEIFSGMVFTRYRVQISEVWKPGIGIAGSQVDVFVPGGIAGRVRQTVPGAPALDPGTDYVLFLWQGRSGRSQVIGLSQGLFTVRQNADGQTLMERPGATEMMIDPKTGLALQDRAVSLRLHEVRNKVSGAGGSGGAAR